MKSRSFKTTVAGVPVVITVWMDTLDPQTWEDFKIESDGTQNLTPWLYVRRPVLEIVEQEIHDFMTYRDED